MIVPNEIINIIYKFCEEKCVIIINHGYYRKYLGPIILNKLNRYYIYAYNKNNQQIGILCPKCYKKWRFIKKKELSYIIKSRLIKYEQLLKILTQKH